MMESPVGAGDENDDARRSVLLLSYCTAADQLALTNQQHSVEERNQVRHATL